MGERQALSAAAHFYMLWFSTPFLWKLGIRVCVTFKEFGLFKPRTVLMFILFSDTVWKNCAFA